ncbi:N-acetylmuramidase domain-containing protein [Parvibaculum sp.]|uniref:N-acetylmuramidase domain-containing protein n=1 Tax=Parvibaculum sp. TaxID=2024848 RepID=UPI00329931F9
MFDEQTKRTVALQAKSLGCEQAALLAVIEVESAGKVYARIDGRNEPLIRFEGHYFDRRLKGSKRAAARSARLANPRAGAVKNPRSQEARWRLLNRAIEIDAKAALESVSWGLGQVMGAHWAWLGYSSVDQLVNVARSGVSGQIELMVRYIEKAGLAAALRRHDWVSFAKGYNGPAYAKWGYHTKMAKAYRRHARRAPTPAPDPAGDSLGPTVLRRGSAGQQVRDLQAALMKLGHPVAVDGRYGPATERAVLAFQKKAGLAVDGVAGRETLAALGKVGVTSDRDPEPVWIRLLRQFISMLRSS